MMDSETNGDTETVQGNGWINDLGFTKAEQKLLGNEEMMIYKSF